MTWDIPPEIREMAIDFYHQIKIDAVLQKVADRLNSDPPLRKEFLEVLNLLAESRRSTALKAECGCTRRSPRV